MPHNDHRQIEFTWAMLDEKHPLPIWRLELNEHDNDQGGYSLRIYGPHGLRVFLGHFSPEHVTYEEHPFTGWDGTLYHSRAWDMQTEDGTPVALTYDAGGPTPPRSHIEIGAESHCSCDIPVELFEEFSACMARPLNTWSTRPGWFPSHEVDQEILAARKLRESGEGQRN